MDSEPPAVGPVAPATADEPPGIRPRPGEAGTRDQEFLEFVVASGRYLSRTAVLLCGDPVRAEELVQATYERTYRSWRAARNGDPQAYARRVLVNLRIDGWRRTRREVLVDPVALPDQAGSDHTGEVVARNAVVQALARLPLAQRRVVVLRHLLDLTETEVAHELEISVGTVKSHHARGIARLREIFAEGDLP
ncbi:SigE family RNA polymerase sigma factor [Catellatospora citrea]|uniref:DNA-directed RNA polymerase sigma-70 factor n=1 Tax=Catellatospora citrea TaxID=53366 RepID=A0A8J3KPP1_9ACTN|nr:SigE family RNA polymerase sigma factor [Catellatospora citrea]RKE10761.1 RNA polymerase sigma-70 factor (sigma-E family) [Catellatospora citrea]GIG01104.1 DNA-directed RNA polymerase sigma-70 factor [Catellatospora citrea]